jgi:tetratricopeptide (TPR) repeat protein
MAEAELSSHSPETRMTREQTRLALFCEGLMEACWLLAAVAVPLAYSPLVTTGFQPVKMLVLQGLALLLAAAWVVRWAESGRFLAPAGVKSAPGTLKLGVVALGSSYLISTAFSLDRAQSLTGSFIDGNGLVSFLAYALLYLTVATQLRTAAQWRRLSTAILIPSIPMALLAISQRLGFDPLSLGKEFDVTARGGVSFAGNPIGLAGYLAMVVPFTLSRLALAARRTADSKRDYPALAVLGTVLVLQAAAIWNSQSRGPILALGLGLVGFILAWGAGRKARPLILRTAGAGAGLVVLLALMAIPEGPLKPLATAMRLERLSTAVPVLGQPDGFRHRLWNTAVSVMFPAQGFEQADGSRDPLHPWRPLSGFGAESLYEILPQYWTLKEQFGNLEKTFHNFFWDTWFQLGILGLAGTLLLFWAGIAGAWAPALKWTRIGGALAAAAGISVLTVLVWRYGWGYLGLGTQLGMGMAFLTATALTGLQKGDGQAPLSSPTLIACGAALLVHLVETGFAFPVPGTSIVFWLSLGLVTAAHRFAELPAEKAAEPCPGDGLDRWATPALSGAVAILFSYSIVQLYFDTARSWQSVLVQTMTLSPGSKEPSFVLPLVAIPALLLMAAMGAVHARSIGPERLGAFFRTLLAAALLGSGYAIAKAAQLSSFSTDFSRATDIVEAFVRRVEVSEQLNLILFVSLGALAILLALQRPIAAQWCHWRGALAALAAVLLVAWGGVKWLLPPLNSDAAVLWADTISSRLGEKPLRARMAVLERAILLDPRNARARIQFSEAASTLAGREPGEGSRENLMSRGANILKTGYDLRALSPVTRSLAGHYELWALMTSQPDQQAQRAREAARYYEQALRYDPSAANTWVASAVLHGTLLRDPQGDQARMKKAEACIRPALGKKWGDLFSRLAENAVTPELAQRYAVLAVKSYQDWLTQTTGTRPDRFSAHLDVAMLQLHLDQPREARANLEKALALDANHDRTWEAHTALAETLLIMGEPQAGLEALDRAIREAPAEVAEKLRLGRQRFAAP